MRGHNELFHVDTLLMAGGLLVGLGGEFWGWLALVLGIFLHQASGGFATGL